MDDTQKILNELKEIKSKLNNIGDLEIDLIYPGFKESAGYKIRAAIQGLIDSPHDMNRRRRKTIDLIKAIVSIAVGVMTLYVLLNR